MIDLNSSKRPRHNQNRMRIALLGGGTWAKKYSDAIVNNKAHYELVGSVTRNNAVEWKNRAPLFQTIEELIKNVKFDAAICATDPSRQYDHTLKLKEFGVPLLLEKPLFTFGSNMRLSELLKRFTFLSTTKTVVNHFQMFNPNFKKYKNLIQNTEITKIEIFEGGPGPVRNFSPALDWGSHAIVIMLLLCERIPERTFLKKETSKDSRKANWHVSYVGFTNKKINKRVQFDLFFGNDFPEKTRLVKAYDIDGLVAEFHTSTNSICHSNPNGLSTHLPANRHDIFRAVLSELNNVAQSKTSVWPHESLIMSLGSLKLLYEIEKNT